MVTTDKVNTRESSFELIRILAQFFIVFYHIFLFFIYPTTDEPFHKAIWLPLHIGVILFVLISGYFCIKPSIKGFIKLIGMMVVLYLPLGVANYLIMGGGKRELASFALIVSATPFWFMRTYVFLYLFSPVINLYLRNSTLIKRFYIILVLGFISHYVGTIGMDPSLLDGKNLVTFLFLYVIGNTLHHYEAIWKRIPSYWYGIVFICVNIVLVVIFSLFTGRIVDAIYERLFFRYCSFGLLVSSLLFFMWIGGISFKSRFINYIAKSSLAIYMIHGAGLIFFNIIGPISLYLLRLSSNEFQLFILIFLLTVIIVTCCIIIDKLLNPIWDIINNLGERLQKSVLSLNLFGEPLNSVK